MHKSITVNKILAWRSDRAIDLARIESLSVRGSIRSGKLRYAIVAKYVSAPDAVAPEMETVFETDKSRCLIFACQLIARAAGVADPSFA
jgi:hypothetical protein